MSSIELKSRAKINLSIDVLGKREDGYHDLEMIMAPITLHDLIYINVIDEGIEILTGVPAGKKDKDGKFSAGSINYLVYEKLKKYAEISEK